MRCHKDPTQKTTQAQKTPTSPTAATSAGALHPISGATPDKGHCTRTEEVHCLRIGCSAPTHKKKRGTDRTYLLPATTSPGASGGLIVPHGHCPTASVVQVARSDSCCTLLILTPTATPQKHKPPQHNQGRQHPGSSPRVPKPDSETKDSRTPYQASRRPRPRTTEASHTPAVSPRPAAPGRRDYPPVLLVLRDIPLGNQARILALNKHLLRRLNVALNEGTTSPRINTHPLRRNIQSVIKPIPILALLGLAVSALQNVAEVPVNHQGILQ